MNIAMKLARTFLEDHPREAALALERMPAPERAAAVRAAGAEAGTALGEMVAPAAAECLSLLAPAEAATTLEHLEPEVAIALLRRLPKTAGKLIAELPAAKQDPMRRILRYPEDTAGALMDPFVLPIPNDVSVAEARVRLRREPHGLLYYVYIVDRSGMLAGVLDIPELMRARARDPIVSIMNTPVEHIPAWTPAPAVAAHPAWGAYHALPVTDETGRFAGAIRYQTLRRLESEAGQRSTAPTGATVGALGELFHLGLAGFVEGVAGAAAAREPVLPVTPASGDSDSGERE
ncbi:MAG TPA: CBS domain-containing protein [Thermoanaerobaculia bacterium]